MSDITTLRAQLVHDSKAILGEGPVWDHKRQLLFWVDIERCKLHCHHPASNTNQEWNFSKMIGAVSIMEDGDLLLALESGLASYSLENNRLEYLGVLENTDPKIRFNDGKCDPAGNFWIGTMHKDFVPGAGNLYSINHKLKVKKQLEETTISNGMAWSLNGKQLYYIDTPSYEVVGFDFDSDKQQISNKKSLICIPKSYGAPDGMTIDNEGMLWVAHWGGGCVRRWNPNQGNVLQEVLVDAPHVTSCCFGGEDLSMLYITTARSGLTNRELASSQLSGGLFCVKTDVAGMPTGFFKHKS